MWMKKFISLIFTSVILAVLFFSCRTVQDYESTPIWFYDLEQAYPQKDYFARVGSGISSEEAILSAQTELASYFSTNIKQIVESSDIMQENQDGSVDKTKKLNVYSVSTTDLNFFAMEKSKPFYYKSDKAWYAVAFINKEKAWSQYEPLVQDSMNSFYSVFNLNNNQNDPLAKIKIYRAAQNEGQEFISRLYKAIIISKELTEKKFGEGRKTYSSIPGLIQKEKDRCVLYFDIKEDYAGIFHAKLNQIFTKLNFPVTQNQFDAFYKVRAKLDYNRQDEDDLIVMNPSVNIQFVSDDGALYVYDAVIEKILSYNSDKAKRTAFNSAAKKLDEELENDFLVKTGIQK